MTATIDSDIERRYAGVRAYRRGGLRRAPHKPLLLAWSIARCLRGLDRLAPFDLAERELSALLSAFGPHRDDRPGAHYPFWRLKNDEGVWEIDSPRPVRVDVNGQASPRELRELGVRAGLSRSDYAYFRANPRTAWRAAARLIDDHFPESLRDAVLSAAGFDVVPEPDSAARGALSVRLPDLRFRRRVLEIYGARCALCGFRLDVSGLPTSLDAALVRWRSHGGPAIPQNGLCLCAVHRAAFDAGGFTIAAAPRDGLLVAIVSDAASGPAARTLRERRHDKPLSIQPPPDLRPAESHIRWHNREVFRTPNQLATA